VLPASRFRRDPAKSAQTAVIFTPVRDQGQVGVLTLLCMGSDVALRKTSGPEGPMPRRRDEGMLREVGCRVGQARRDRGWTQEALAEAVGIEPVTLSRLETGDRALSLTMLAQISEILGVGLGDLVDVARPTPTTDIAPEHAELLRLFGGLAPSAKDVVLRMVRELSKS
jgi:transcriptional regulator with XRE-family HTH domain